MGNMGLIRGGDSVLHEKNERYVDWIRYMTEPWPEDIALIPSSADPPDDAVRWRDVVTGTLFYIRPKVAETVVRHGLRLADALVENLPPEDKAQILYQYLAAENASARLAFLHENGFKETETDNLRLGVLLPELPGMPDAGGREVPDCWRVVDSCVLRVGFLFALIADSVSGKEWPRLRYQCLRRGLMDFAPVGRGKDAGMPKTFGAFESAVKASHFLAGGTGETGVLDGMPGVDLVKGGAVKITDYFMESSQLREVRGASILLDQINRQRYYAFFEGSDDLTPEGIIYAGGGHMLAMVPEGKGAKVAREIEKLHARVTLTASSVAASITVSLGKLAADFRGVTGSLEFALANRQGARVDFAPEREKGDINLWNPGEPLVDGSPFSAPQNRYCSSCGVRRAVHMVRYEDDERLLCASCGRKFSVGGQYSRQAFVQAYHEHLLAGHGGADIPEIPRYLADVAGASRDGRHVAMVYGDGNNFGALVERMDTAGKFRYFSQLTQNIAFRATFEALEKHIGTAPVEMIAIGGDDILLVLPADAALATAITLGRAFDRAFCNLSTGEQKVTMSMGVVVAGAKTPLRYQFEIATGLLQSAKTRARAEAGAGKPCGTLDVVVLESCGTFEGDVQEYRTFTVKHREYVRKFLFSMRPYTWTEAEAVRNLVCMLRDGKGAVSTSLIYALRQAAMDLEPDEAELFYLYQYARAKGRTRKLLDKGLNGIRQGFGFRSNKGAEFFLRREGEWICPWVDVVELWDYAESEVAGV